MKRRSRQLELELREAPTWGGRRVGAGRKCGPSPRHAHRARDPLAGPLPCHVTLKVRRELPSLRTARLVREWERSLAAACERGRFRVVHYSLQNDHLHAIVEATSQRDLAHGMKSIGSRLARAVNRIFGRRGPVLADRYHLHVLRTPREVRPLVLRLESKIPTGLFSSLDPPSVAPPRTWLLRAGWRRHGLVSPAEVPGEPASSSR